MIKGVTKNLPSTSSCTRSPLRESMQSGSNLAKNPPSENLTPVSMATALVTSNSTSVSLSDSSHTGYLNGDLSVESKALKLTFRRNKAPSDTASIPSPSTKPDDSCKNNDPQSGVPIISMHADNSSLHRHTAVNGKMLPVSSSPSVSHSTHSEPVRSGNKRASGSSASSKRPKSASKRDRNASSKPSGVLSLNASSTSTPLVVNGRQNSNERNHDPYQFSVKKEDEPILPPKKLRLDSSLNRLTERAEAPTKDQGTNTRNQATSVDADLLGPCEPGTHVNLDGYVCLETMTGMLMVSVVWRGRTYLGTLIDSSSHGFSPPIPPSYVYASQRYVSGVDASGAAATSTANGRNQRGRGRRRCGFAPTSAARHSRKGRRNPRGSPSTLPACGTGSVTGQGLLVGGGDDSNEECQSRGESPASETALYDDEDSMMRYKCPQSGCEKRFKEVKAMKFHHDECHTKKTVCEALSDSEAREKPRSKPKSTSKSKRYSGGAGVIVGGKGSPSVSPAMTSSSSSFKQDLSTYGDGVTIKAETVEPDLPTASFFKAPVSNGISSPPVNTFSPSSPSVPSLPHSPANGLKLPHGNSTSACGVPNGQADMNSLPLHATSSASSLPATTKSLSHAPQPHATSTASQQSGDLSVRIPASNLMVRVGVSTSGATSVNSSSSSTSRTVAAVTVPVKTIPVMMPSTVASASASSATLVNSGKKISSKESKTSGSYGGGGGAKSSGGRGASSQHHHQHQQHASGATVTASSVTIPRATSPTAPPGSSLKPIQPKPAQSTAASSPSPSSLGKSLPPSASGSSEAKRPTSSGANAGSGLNPNRKRKKPACLTTEGSGKRQSIAHCASGSRSGQAKPSGGAKSRHGDSNGPAGADGCNSNQGDRASPAYSDISDDNESPIPILEKEGDVKVIGDSVASGDEIGKTSEQTSGGGAFYNTPPSLVPFSVYSGDQAASAPAVGAPGNGGSGGGANRSMGASPSVPGRPGPLVGKKGELVSGGNQVRSTATVIPGTSPLPLSSGGPALKRMDSASGRVKADVVDGGAGEAGDKAARDVESKSRVPSRSESAEEPSRGKKEPPNLTKIPSSLSLSLPASSANSAVTTVAKPTPLNPLSPSRSSSDIPASAPAVVTPGALVGASRSANDLYAARPDHLRTPPSFHPGPPFGPGAAAAAAAQFAAHMSPSGLGPQPSFPPYTPETLMRFVPNGPHGPGHPFPGYPYAEPFFGGGPPPPAVSSAPQPHKIHELVEKGIVSSASTSAPPCSTSASAAACAGLKQPGVDASSAIDLQTAKSLADMAVAMRHHASMVPNHAGLPQGPHAGIVPAHFQYGGAIPPAHMAAGPPFAAMQQHSLPPGHPSGHGGADPFFSPTIMNHTLYK